MSARNATWFGFGLYLGAGLFSGALMHAALPALNVLGMSYIGLTWPAQIYCAPVSRGCSAMPPDWAAPYLFTFQEHQTT